MHIVLLQDIKGIGKKHEVKDVKEGYARNFLIPRGLAVLATPPLLAYIAHKDAQLRAARDARVQELQTRAVRLAKLSLSFCLKTGEKGEVFGSISARDIERALAEKGYHETAVNLARPLKALGDHDVEIDLGEGIKTKIQVKIEKE